jgi:hypothetical protein
LREDPRDIHVPLLSRRIERARASGGRLACASIALLGPVRRATQVDPINVLR